MLTQVTVCVDGIPYDVAIRINERGRLLPLALRTPSGGPWIQPPFGWARLKYAAQREASQRLLYTAAREYYTALDREFGAERAAHPERFIGGADPAQKEE